VDLQKKSGGEREDATAKLSGALRLLLTVRSESASTLRGHFGKSCKIRGGVRELWL